MKGAAPPRRAWAPCLVLALVVAGAPAGAQQRSEAEVRYERGVALFTARNYEGALLEFQRSLALSGGVDLLFNIGRTYQAMGRYAEAAQTIDEYLRRARDLPPERRQEVSRMLTTLRGFIAHLRVRVTPADATVTLDGESVSRERLASALTVNPGRHVVTAQRSGYTTTAEPVVVASGESRDVTVSLSAAPASLGEGTLVLRNAPASAVLRVDGVVARSPVRLPVRTHRIELGAPGFASWRGEVLIEPQRSRVLTAHMERARGLSPRWFILGACATGAAALVGGVFGGLTLAARSEFDQRLRYSDVAADRDLADRGETFRTVANVGFGAAAALGVATVVLLTQTGFGVSATTVDVAAAPGGLQLRF
ncbi:MAG: PEGA domain-containing protein [Myxococcaceae bacterium]|nr:MAG: PEGA domain-containing protein [Myxococcaceae bacterium]